MVVSFLSEITLLVNQEKEEKRKEKKVVILMKYFLFSSLIPLQVLITSAVYVCLTLNNNVHRTRDQAAHSQLQ